ncbi:hypothetical protein PVK06_002250 [Gossypium arboreum]|uniref:Uncharacterized protein n=1 Tax=Gossypium arboreum TaxID=29729 RepID=A0ABR0R492_GOSAR|nr:hypothetical protein PVK06_002250 [Gossypium arboreum]
MSTAQHVLRHQTYRLITDGRRIIADETGIIQNNRDEESIRLLKKIDDMEIDDFSSQIIEEIRNTWELWNSPKLSPDSLHLDKIKLMNLDNIQEG